jgi:hypothetical protein
MTDQTFVQIWRGIPASGGQGWVTYGRARPKADAIRLLSWVERIRPEFTHRLEVCQ